MLLIVQTYLWLFGDRVTKHVRFPFCETNEKSSKSLRLNIFTRHKSQDHKSCIINEGTCSCGLSSYVGETKRIAQLQFEETR